MFQVGQRIISLNPRHSFRSRLGLAIASTILFFSLLLSWIISDACRQEMRANSGEFTKQLAYQMALNLDRGMFVYFQEIQTLATLNVIRDLNEAVDNKRILLENLQRAYNDFAWIGLTDDQGIVLASTGKLLEGKNVAVRPWFINGKKAPSVEDVHGAKLLATLVPNPAGNGEPPRFVDVASPVYNLKNEFVGVLGGHLYWQWANQLRDDLLKPIEKKSHVEVIIVSTSGEVLLAPSSSKSLTNFSSPELNLKNLQSFHLAQQHKNGYYIENWLDKQSYLTGYAKTQGLRQYPGLGWTILVRQSTEVAFAPARFLEEKIMLWGTTLGIAGGILAWAIAGRLVKPVLAIASVANRIRNGEKNLYIPIIPGVDEVARLSQSLFKLFISLEEQNSLLATFNDELEERVKIRTSQLDQLNQQLTSEIEERKVTQLALQQANMELERLTMLDGLTGVANRRCFDERLSQEWLRAAREKLPLSLIMIDVDYFKRYNDHYGHQAGDHCLQQVAQVLTKTIKRSSDLVARYGGEEFAVILPHTEVKNALQIAETIRQAMKDLQIPHAASEVSQFITISMGTATQIPVCGFSPSVLIKSADEGLYQAKAQGRDRVVSADLLGNIK